MVPDPRAVRFRRPTPRDESYRWPAEWERHEGTWLAWPHDPETWSGVLDEVEEQPRGLRLERNARSTALQGGGGGIEGELAKTEQPGHADLHSAGDF